MAGQKKIGDYVPTRGLPSGLSNWLVFALLLVWSIFSVFSLLWVAVTSLRTDQGLFSSPWGMPTIEVAVDSNGRTMDQAMLGALSPDELAKVTKVQRFEPQWINYKIAWTIAKMGQYTMNSVIVTCASVFFIVIISGMAAYSITKSEFLGAKSLFYYFLAGLAVPASLLLVPLFMTLKDFNITDLRLFSVGGYWLIHIKDFYLIDSRLGLILIYTTMGIPFTVFVLTGFSDAALGPGRVGRGRRRDRVHDVLEDIPAAREAGARYRRDIQLPLCLERIPIRACLHIERTSEDAARGALQLDARDPAFEQLDGALRGADDTHASDARDIRNPRRPHCQGSHHGSHKVLTGRAGNDSTGGDYAQRALRHEHDGGAARDSESREAAMGSSRHGSPLSPFRLALEELEKRIAPSSRRGTPPSLTATTAPARRSTSRRPLRKMPWPPLPRRL